MKTTASKLEVIQAIETINKKYGYQIRLNRNDQSGK
jgi:hypothetical protein